MKSFPRKAVSLFLALTLLLSTAAVAAPAYGEELDSRQLALQEGVTLSRQRHWSSYYSNLRQEFYVTYTPGERVTPMTFYGGAVTTKVDAADAIAAAEASGKRVIFGVNGDFIDSNGTKAPTMGDGE